MTKLGLEPSSLPWDVEPLTKPGWGVVRVDFLEEEAPKAGLEE